MFHRTISLSLTVLVVCCCTSGAFGKENDVRLATSDIADVSFSDVKDKWPFLGTTEQKRQLVRDALLEKIYAHEAENQNLAQSPQVAERIDEVELSAILEALFLRQTEIPKVTEKEAQQYYESHKEWYSVGETVLLRHISIPIENPSDPVSEMKAEARAKEAVQHLRNGQDFEKVAREYSSDQERLGSPIGPLLTEMVVEDWGKEASKLFVGEISDPIDQRDRFEILQILEKHEPKQWTFEEARHAIETKLGREKLEAARAEFVQSLLESIPIEIDHRAIADPQTKGRETVVKAEDFRMTLDEFVTWLKNLPLLKRRHAQLPRGREELLRKEFLLQDWILKKAEKEKLTETPEYQSSFEQQKTEVLANAYEEFVLDRNQNLLKVSEKEIRDFYDKNKTDLVIPEKAVIKDIIIDADPEVAASEKGRPLAFRYAKEEALKTLEEINTDKITFEMASLKFKTSYGPGNTFEVMRGARGESFDDIVFNLQPGEISSEPIRVDEGYQIVRLVNIIPQVDLSLEQVREVLEQKLAKDKEKQFRRNLEHRLLSEANAQILVDNFEKVGR